MPLKQTVRWDFTGLLGFWVKWLPSALSCSGRGGTWSRWWLLLLFCIVVVVFSVFQFASAAPGPSTRFFSLLINYLLIPSTHTSTTSISMHTHTELVPHEHIFLSFIFFTHPVSIAHEHTNTHRRERCVRDPFFISEHAEGKAEIL